MRDFIGFIVILVLGFLCIWGAWHGGYNTHVREMNAIATLEDAAAAVECDEAQGDG